MTWKIIPKRGRGMCVSTQGFKHQHFPVLLSSFYFQVCCVLSGTTYVVCFFEPWMALRIEWADKFFPI